MTKRYCRHQKCDYETESESIEEMLAHMQHEHPNNEEVLRESTNAMAILIMTAIFSQPTNRATSGQIHGYLQVRNVKYCWIKLGDRKVYDIHAGNRS